MITTVFKTLAYMIMMTICLILIVIIVTQEDKSTEDFHAVRRTRFFDPKDSTKEGIQRKLTIVETISFFVLAVILSVIF